MDNLMLGLKVAAIGIIGVFVVLCILMGAIKGFEYLLAFVAEKTKEKKAAHAPVSAPAAITAAPAAVLASPASEDESEVVAAITAAIMVILQGENAGEMPSFTIRKIKQIKRN